MTGADRRFDRHPLGWPLLVVLLIAAGILLFHLTSPTFPVGAQPGDVTPSGFPLPQTDVEEIESRVLQAIQEEDHVLAFVLYDVEIDQIEIAPDRSWALAWLGFVDPETGAPVPTEPGLAIAQRVGESWHVVLQADSEWTAALEKVPEALFPASARLEWQGPGPEQAAAAALGPYTGYLLPWASGQSKYLTRSISHGIGSSMHYAFDFAEPGFPSDMFAVYAAKAGYVKYAVWSYPNGYFDGTCGHANYLVLEDPSTEPTTYVLYLHLAQNSIPSELRVPGAYVTRGRFLGWADDTGCSTGNHLHFQVHTNPNSYWGSSVDILFSDVPINGGRPRTPNEANNYPEYGSEGQWLYTSQNNVSSDGGLPYGALTQPAQGATITTSSVQIKGWATDDQSGFDHAQLVAHFGGNWREIGPSITSPNFQYAWDMCADHVPDGPVSLGVRVWDREGNIAILEGLRHTIKQHACPRPPPACVPAANQVALFSDSNFGGVCGLLGFDDYANGAQFLIPGDANAASLLVGTSAQVTAFTQPDFQGRSSTWTANDSNLDDNLVRNDQIRSLTVTPLNTMPSAPVLTWPPDGFTTSADTAFPLVWRNTGPATSFQVRLSGPTGTANSTWLALPRWTTRSEDLGALSPGEYQWEARARNGSGDSPWSASRSFTITAPAPPPGVVLTSPYTTDFEGEEAGWITSGLWERTDSSEAAHSGTHAWHFGQADGESYQGDEGASWGALTSPPIHLDPGEHALQFWYRYETEDPAGHWDARWIQLAIEDGPFTTLHQLQDDVMNYWLRSPEIDLSAHAGETIRIRFLFHTLDDDLNEGGGWWIDDFDVRPASPQPCADPQEPNSTPGAATPLEFGDHVQAAICPAGDVDFYTFNATAGARMVVDIDAESLGSSLDSHIFLYDEDGQSLLASHDDEIPYALRDSHLGFAIPRAGAYFLKVKAWNHPGAGGDDYLYELRLLQDAGRPQLSLDDLVSGTYLPEGDLPIEAIASDAISGLRRVAFFLHSGNWLSDPWALLDEDLEAQDGWATVLATDDYPEQKGMALYVEAEDWAGNTLGVGRWELGIDHSPPQSTLHALPPVGFSSAVDLRWSATDNVSGLAGFDLQVRADDGQWETAFANLPPDSRQTWFVGELGRLYAFRLRAGDMAGNTEAYPAEPETVTLMSVCSTPDSWEADGVWTLARAIPVDGSAQFHNICLPAGETDVDWVTFPAAAGTHYRISGVPTHPSAAIRLRLHASDGTTVLAESSAEIFGQMAALEWTADVTGDYYLRIEHIDERVAGNDVGYWLWVESGHETHLPLVQR